MAVFAFEAIDASGKKQRREIEAGNKQDALSKIRALGLRPTKLQEKKGAKAPAAGGAPKTKKKGLVLFDRISQQDLTQFTQQLSTLQDAGLPSRTCSGFSVHDWEYHRCDSYSHYKYAANSYKVGRLG